MIRARHNQRRGYSLVEVLVAISVLLIALVGPITIAYSGLKRANFAKEQTMAVFLAQEGAEAVVKLREDRALLANSLSNINQVWNHHFPAIQDQCPIGSPDYCGVRIVDTEPNKGNASFYQCSGSNCTMVYNEDALVPYKQGPNVAGEPTIYTRQLQVTVNSAFTRVISAVSWGASPSQRVELETYVYNIYYEPES